jgi:hypothetical protein
LREKKARKAGMLQTIDLFEKAKEELKYVFSRASSFEEGQKLRVEVLVKTIATLNGITPGKIATRCRVILGMPILLPSLEMDLKHDIAVVKKMEEDLGALEGEYGFSRSHPPCKLTN